MVFLVFFFFAFAWGWTLKTERERWGKVGEREEREREICS